MYLYPTEQGERLNRPRLDSSPLGLFKVNLEFDIGEFIHHTLLFCYTPHILESSISFNPKQAKGGRNQDAACLDALPVR